MLPCYASSERDHSATVSSQTMGEIAGVTHSIAEEKDSW
jgi:hypothetical protein